MNNMKKFALLLSAALIALTACDPMEEIVNEPITPKFVEKITNAVDGSVISLSYDSDMRVTGVTKTNPTDSSQDRHYEVKYNLDMTTNTVTFDIISGENKFVMEFNEYGALKEFVREGSTREVLSTFVYNNYTSVSAFHLELKGMVDNLTGGEAKRIDWSYGTPVNQINQIDRVIENEKYTYSTSIQYEYLAYCSNVRANVNFFNLLTPEFLEYSNIPTELAATVSVFGSRSSYLPTDVTLTKGRSEAGENYVKLTEETREFSYELDERGYISKIFTGKEESKNKKLLYTIEYANVKQK